MENEEKNLYSGSNVTVTSARFIAGSKTYSLRNISSVDIGKIPPKRGLSSLLILVGLVMVFIEGLRIYGLIILAIGIFVYSRANPKYTVRINSNSGEADGYISSNKSEIEAIVKALNDAIINLK